MPRSDAQVTRLLEAVSAMSSDLSLPVVLRRIVASACHLVDAQYAALLGSLAEWRAPRDSMMSTRRQRPILEAAGDAEALERMQE